MNEVQDRQCREDLGRHEGEVAKLAQSLADLNEASVAAGVPAPQQDRQALFITAQIIRHRVSIELLRSRIDDAPVVGPRLVHTASPLATRWR